MTGPGSPPYLVAPGSPPKAPRMQPTGRPVAVYRAELGGRGEKKINQFTWGSKKETHFLDYHAGTFGVYTALKFLIHEQRLMYG